MALKAMESSTAVIGNVHLVYDKYEADREILKQKRKRCLAIAKACDKYAFALELQGQGRSTELLKRHNRAIERKYKWLELADKFKECMNA